MSQKITKDNENSLSSPIENTKEKSNSNVPHNPLNENSNTTNSSSDTKSSLQMNLRRLFHRNSSIGMDIEQENCDEQDPYQVPSVLQNLDIFSIEDNHAPETPEIVQKHSSTEMSPEINADTVKCNTRMHHQRSFEKKVSHEEKKVSEENHRNSQHQPESSVNEPLKSPQATKKEAVYFVLFYVLIIK